MSFEDQLTVAMRSTAETVTPPVADLVAGGMQRGRDLRHRQTVRFSVLAGAGMLTAGAVTAALVAAGGRGARVITPGLAGPATSPRPTITFDASAKVRPDQTVALAIDRMIVVGGALDRHDPTAATGPWTVVVRSDNGSLGHHGAVVTFPVAAPTAGQPTPVGSVSGAASAGMVIWPIADQYARIRGDLTTPELVAIATDTSIISGHPVVRHPPRGYAVVSSGTYQSPDIRESRYSSTGLGVAADLGDGLTYTGVTTGGGFEDQLYNIGVLTQTTVNGKPAVVSSVLGGNATLAWEPAPGVIAYVGYSGALTDDNAITALRALAARTQPLSLAQWQTANPQSNDQPNTLG